MDNNNTNSVMENVENPPVEKELKLVDVPVVDENTALNVMVSFLSLANKRGSFTLEESAKIWECISKFKNADQ